MDDLTQLRKKIDATDQKILTLLAKRAEVCKEIGNLKKAKGLPVRDSNRENEVYARIREEAAKMGLNPAEAEAVYREIVNMCSSVQE
jgi:chorismate mutase